MELETTRLTSALRAGVAVLSSARLAVLPDVPTVAEVGLPDLTTTPAFVFTRLAARRASL